MTNRWYYTHGTSILGPATAEQLRERMVTNELLPTDLTWPETDSIAEAVEAQAWLEFQAQTRQAPSWVAEMQAPPSPPERKPAVPDWLADVEQANPPRRGPAVPPPLPPSAASGENRPPLDTLPIINVELVALPGHATPASPITKGSIQVGGFSSVGLVRERNEDRFFAYHWDCVAGPYRREGALLILADGMGGYQGGERASAVTVRVAAEQLLLLPLRVLTDPDDKLTTETLLDAVVHALVEANRVVFEEANAEAQFKGMGATAALALIWEGRAIVSHVGDCRVYLQRGDALIQLTKDQTLVGRMVELGQLTPEEAEQHPNRNEVLQAIGKRRQVDPSRQEELLRTGDRVVLACDGLDAHVPFETLRLLLASSTKSPAELASECVGLADQGGGTDNCTVVIAQCH
jgi:protein phosphatase